MKLISKVAVSKFIDLAPLYIEAGTGRRVVGDLLSRQGTMCYTLEMSFFSPPPQQEAWSATTSNEETYENFGRAMVRRVSFFFFFSFVRFF